MPDTRRLAAIALAAIGLAAPGGVASAAPVRRAAPCTAPNPACADWVRVGRSAARTMIYRSFPLDVRNRSARRALIMVHGTLRNADHYFRTAASAAFLAGALGDTVIIAPDFASADPGCGDTLRPREVSWSCHGDSWRSGGAASSNPELTSFDLVDALLRLLADKKIFPNLTTLVIAGHSAGGQFVSRYEMANRVHERLGLAVSYVVANPSSYAWPDAIRVRPTNDGSPASVAGAWKDETPHVNFQYGPPDAAAAPDYDRWPYGLEGRAGGYTARMSDALLRKQLAARPTTYLLSQVDVLPLGGFDDTPGAMAQGATRRERGEAFVNYINTRLGAAAKALIVPECGHNDRCVFTTDTVLPALFPKPAPGY